MEPVEKSPPWAGVSWQPAKQSSGRDFKRLFSPVVTTLWHRHQAYNWHRFGLAPGPLSHSDNKFGAKHQKYLVSHWASPATGTVPGLDVYKQSVMNTCWSCEDPIMPQSELFAGYYSWQYSHKIIFLQLKIFFLVLFPIIHWEQLVVVLLIITYSKWKTITLIYLELFSSRLQNPILSSFQHISL